MKMMIEEREGFDMKIRKPEPLQTPQRVRLGNIVVATDFSPASERALGYALAIARRYDSHLYVLHVIRPELYTLNPPESSGRMVELVRQSAEQEMVQVLISGKLREVSHQAVIKEGEVWTVLAGLVGESGADLIVVGTHGRKGLEKMFLGSVAERVFRISDRPVLTVGPGVAKAAPAEVELKRILYATDFHPNSLAALPYAVSLAQEHQATIRFLHVIDNAEELSPATLNRLRESFTERLEALLPPGADLWCKPEFAVSVGEPPEQILEAARCWQADLLVLGIRGGGIAVDHLPMSDTYRIVTHAPCPVLTVRG